MFDLLLQLIPHKRIIHGDTFAEPYYWMIDYFKQGPSSDGVIKYLQSENEYTNIMMANTESF